MLKFARADIITSTAVLYQPSMSRTASLRMQAHRAVFDYEPRPGYLYVRSRAISSRCNDNFDEFPAEEIKAAYRTFIGKPVFVNHNNDNHRRSRGVIIDAALHEDRNPDNTPDTWAEVLMEVDAVNFPILAKAIIAGEIDRTSMGTDVAYSICSACGNKASSPAEYCAHIPRMKGKRIYQVNASVGSREGVLVREKCFGLKFFENSLLVEDPADPTAYFLGVDTRGVDGGKTASKTAGEVVDSPQPERKAGSEPHTFQGPDGGACRQCGWDADLYHHSPKRVEYWNSDKRHADEAAKKDSHEREARGYGSLDPSTIRYVQKNGLGGCQYPSHRSGSENIYSPNPNHTPATHLGNGGHPVCDEHRGAFSHLPPVEKVLGEEAATRWATDALGHQAEGADWLLSQNHQGPTKYSSKEYPRLDGVTLDQDDKGYFVKTHRARSDSYESPEAIPDAKIEFIRSTGAAIPVSDGDRLFYQHMHEQGQRDQEMHDHMSTAVTDLTDRASLKAHMFTAHGWDESDLWRNSHPQDHPRMSPGNDEDRPLRHDEVRGAHDHEHEVEYPEDYPHTTLGNSHFHHTGARTASGCDHPNSYPEGCCDEHDPEHGRFEYCPDCNTNLDTGKKMASLQAEAASKAEDFLAANPPSVHHILERFHAATPEQHDAGMNWYQDSHHIAKAIGHGDVSKAAGLMGVYSAGTPVAPNYHYASRSILHNTAVGGKVNPLPPEHSDFHGKPNASGLQAEQATRMLNGEHHSTVLTSPKVSNYAHLIEHGDNEPGREGPERVVIDRHAVSAAIGRRVTDKEFGALGLSTTDNGKRITGGGGAVHDYGDDKNSRYHHIANIYRQAAHHLRSEGHDVKAHQVQAVAWGVQKGRNDADDNAHVEAKGPLAGNIKGRQTAQDRQRDAWEKHHKDVHDELGLPANPRGHWGSKRPFIPTEDDMRDFTSAISPRVAFGETKAPADVDTLRDEECPVCGERDSYDGNSCQKCGFDAPPQMFQDPDLGAAKALDLRKDIAQDAGTLPGAVTDQDANAGMPGEVPGSGVPGSDEVPVDPSMVDGEGNVTPGADPAQIAQQQMDLLQSGQPITPDMLGPNGEMAMDPSLDPEAATGHFDQGGEAFTPGPNAPTEPGGPEDPISPDEVDEEGNPLDGQQEVVPAREGDPGTPEDGVADLQCPACGFSSDAEQPQSVDMDDQALAAPGAGTMAGDVCPNCQQAQLLSVGEMEQMNGAPARV